MTEGWTRHLKGDRIEAHSAGIETHGLNPRAVRVMAETLSEGLAGKIGEGRAGKIPDEEA